MTPNPEPRRRDRAAAAVAVGLLALAAVIYMDMTRLAAVARQAAMGPTIAPTMVACGLAVLGIWTALEAWRGDFPEREHQELGPVLWIVAGLALQMLLLKPLGFSIATGVLFGFAAAGFGRRRLWISIPAGIVGSLAVFGVFAKLLQLSLPAGPLESLLF